MVTSWWRDVNGSGEGSRYLSYDSLWIEGDRYEIHKVLSKQTHCIPVETIKRKCILIHSSCSGSDYDLVAKIFDYCHLSV